MGQPGAFAEQLRRQRAAAGLSQEELAERAGLTASAVGALERGERRRPHPHTVRALADALGLRDAERSALLASVPPRRAVAPVHPLAAGGSEAAAPAGLPKDLTPLLGREREVAVVLHLMARPEVRLLTLTGPGGVGKTRLACQAAAEAAGSFPDGVVFVSLAAVHEPGLVPDAVARALGVPGAGGAMPMEGVAAAVGDRGLLLLLDNFEHLSLAAPRVAELLLRCPGLSVLATSRSPLRLRGEQEYRVPPLGVPGPADVSPSDLLRSPAARLFAARAQAVLPEFAVTDDNAAAINAICARLDGLPLAIELAAARLRLFPPEALLARLEGGLGVLAGGARDLPDRQRTMRDTIAWSHDLLTEDERALFRRLAVFAGGFTVEAAEAVGAGDAVEPDAVLELLAGLVEQSLAVGEPDPAGAAGWYRMLEPIRQYALGRLEAGEADAAEARRRHAAFYRAMAEAAHPQLRGPRQAAALTRLEADLGNVRLAMRWLLDRRDREGAARLAWALWPFWRRRGHHDEVRGWMEEALAEGHALSPAARARALGVTGMMLHRLGENAHLLDLVEESATLFRAVGDAVGAADVLAVAGMARLRSGDPTGAARRLEESLDLLHAVGDTWGEAEVLTFLGAIPFLAGDLGQAGERFERALRLARRVGDDVAVFGPLHLLALVRQAEGAYDRAAAYHWEALACAERTADKTNLAHALEGMAAWWGGRGEPERAARLYGAAEAILAGLGLSFGSFETGSVVHERYLSSARRQLGEAAWDAARADGRAMTADRALACARSSPPAEGRR